MTVNFSSVIRIMSVLFVVLGVSMLPALLVACIYHETYSIVAFAVVSIHCFGYRYILGIHSFCLTPFFISAYTGYYTICQSLLHTVFVFNGGLK